MDAAFEFFVKIEAPFWCFHDRDIAPEGATLAESNRNLDKLVAHAKALQKATGVRLLWGTANLFSNPRYMCGAATNPDAHVFAYAAAQVKKALEVTQELGGDGYVFLGRARGLRDAAQHQPEARAGAPGPVPAHGGRLRQAIGFKGQFYIEPKPKEPTKHQYDFDVASGIAFLRTFGLEKHLKFNIETNHATLAGHTFQHEIEVAAAQGMLGSIDANTGDPLLGWDTDQFNTDVKEITLAMVSILRRAASARAGSISTRSCAGRPSTPRTSSYAHIGGMDTYALAFKIARRIIADGELDGFLADRYSSYDSGYGREIEKGAVGFRELEKLVLTKLGEPKPRAGARSTSRTCSTAT
jgi:xylose isomerase